MFQCVEMQYTDPWTRDQEGGALLTGEKVQMCGEKYIEGSNDRRTR
jgi:hypothetical protein